MYYSRTVLIGKVIRPNGWPDAVRLHVAENGNKTSTFMLSVKTMVGEYEHDDWHYIVTFNYVAERCKRLLEEGMEILVEGRFKRRKAGPRGQEKERWELIAELVKDENGDMWREPSVDPPKGKVVVRNPARSENW